jgi:hypothetical protein
VDIAASCFPRAPFGHTEATVLGGAAGIGCTPQRRRLAHQAPPSSTASSFRSSRSRALPRSRGSRRLARLASSRCRRLLRRCSRAARLGPATRRSRTRAPRRRSRRRRSRRAIAHLHRFHHRFLIARLAAPTLLLCSRHGPLLGVYARGLHAPGQRPTPNATAEAMRGKFLS